MNGFPVRTEKGSRPDSPSTSESIVSKAPTEQNLKGRHNGGSLAASSSKGSLTASSSLSDLLAYEQLHVDTQSDPLMQKRLDEFEAELRSSRPAFLNILKGIGLKKLSDRQRVANALSALLRERTPVADRKNFVPPSVAEMRKLGWVDVDIAAVRPPVEAPYGQPPVVVTPGDPHLWFTPFNWLVSSTALNGEPGAVCVCPGAYLRLDWEGQYGAPLAIVVDTSAADDTFIAVACARDDGLVEAVVLPHGDAHARVELPLLHGGGAAEPASDVIDELAGHERHRLWIGLHSSKQKLDRWGDKGTLPVCSLRLRAVHLPPGVTPVAPRLRPLRMLFFGDSIVEGIAAEYVPSRLGDLANNAAGKTFVDAAARQLNAEYSSVGYGRQGWTVPGNGNVPPFASVTGGSDCSWDKLWAHTPREFAARGGPHVDVVLVQHGTCDGIIAGPPSAANVRLAVAAFLPKLRAALGPHTKVFLCVPFGGFGGNFQPPQGALYSGYHQYASGGAPQKSKKQLESKPVDPLTFYAQFSLNAAYNLDGFKIDAMGFTKSSRESYDGVHPLSVRHAELGSIVAERVITLLKSHPLAAEPYQPHPAPAAPAAAEPTGSADRDKEGGAAGSGQPGVPAVQQMFNAVGGLFKRALPSDDRRGSSLLDGCGMPASGGKLEPTHENAPAEELSWPEFDHIALAPASASPRSRSPSRQPASGMTSPRLAPIE